MAYKMHICIEKKAADKWIATTVDQVYLAHDLMHELWTARETKIERVHLPRGVPEDMSEGTKLFYESWLKNNQKNACHYLEINELYDDYPIELDICEPLTNYPNLITSQQKFYPIEYLSPKYRWKIYCPKCQKLTAYLNGPRSSGPPFLLSSLLFVDLFDDFIVKIVNEIMESIVETEHCGVRMIVFFDDKSIDTEPRK